MVLIKLTLSAVFYDILITGVFVINITTKFNISAVTGSLQGRNLAPGGAL